MKDNYKKKNNGKISSRSSTIMGGYIKSVLDKCELTRAEKVKYFEKYGFNLGECAYCGGKANTLDHLFCPINDSLFTGYDNNIRNLIPCCQICNSSKGKKTIYEWLDNPTTELAKKIVEEDGYEERRKKIDNYIKQNKSYKKSINKKIVKKLNERAKQFKLVEQKYLEELDQILENDRAFYCKIVENKQSQTEH